jgi:hypothetical protein
MDMTYTSEELEAIAANMAEYARQGLTEYVLVNKETGQTTAYRIDMTPAEKSEIIYEANAMKKYAQNQNPMKAEMKK